MSSGRGDWPADPGDEEILVLAYQEGRILITIDKNFGELAVVREQAHAGIIRLVVLSASQQAPTCMMVLNRYGTELQSGAIVTVEPGRIRVRPPTAHPEPAAIFRSWLNSRGERRMAINCFAMPLVGLPTPRMRFQLCVCSFRDVRKINGSRTFWRKQGSPINN